MSLNARVNCARRILSTRRRLGYSQCENAVGWANLEPGVADVRSAKDLLNHGARSYTHGFHRFQTHGRGLCTSGDDNGRSQVEEKRGWHDYGRKGSSLFCDEPAAVTAMQRLRDTHPSISYNSARMLFRKRLVRVRRPAGSDGEASNVNPPATVTKLTRVKADDVISPNDDIILPVSYRGADARIMDPASGGNGARGVSSGAHSAEDVAWLRSCVVHMDEDTLLLNKPYGLAVQGGHRVSRSLDSLLRGSELFANSKGDHPRLVHRLDRDTSGLLLMARSSMAAAVFTDAFRHHSEVSTHILVARASEKKTAGSLRLDQRPTSPTTAGGDDPGRPGGRPRGYAQRCYWALVSGHVKAPPTPGIATPKSSTMAASSAQGTAASKAPGTHVAAPGSFGVIAAPLCKLASGGSDKEKMAVASKAALKAGGTDPQPALTAYQVVAYSPVHNVTWLRLFPQTGRKHQLRVHCGTSLRAPIVGDFKYGYNGSVTMRSPGSTASASIATTSLAAGGQHRITATHPDTNSNLATACEVNSLMPAGGEASPVDLSEGAFQAGSADAEAHEQVGGAGSLGVAAWDGRLEAVGGGRRIPACRVTASIGRGDGAVEEVDSEEAEDKGEDEDTGGIGGDEMVSRGCLPHHRMQLCLHARELCLCIPRTRVGGDNSSRGNDTRQRGHKRQQGDPRWQRHALRERAGQTFNASKDLGDRKGFSGGIGLGRSGDSRGVNSSSAGSRSQASGIGGDDSHNHEREVRGGDGMRGGRDGDECGGWRAVTVCACRERQHVLLEGMGPQGGAMAASLAATVKAPVANVGSKGGSRHGGHEHAYAYGGGGERRADRAKAREGACGSSDAHGSGLGFWNLQGTAALPSHMKRLFEDLGFDPMIAEGDPGDKVTSLRVGRGVPAKGVKRDARPARQHWLQDAEPITILL
eukprot:jgi/Mesvir1/20718/Mv14912-RA.1